MNTLHGEDEAVQSRFSERCKHIDDTIFNCARLTFMVGMTSGSAEGPNLHKYLFIGMFS